MTDQCEHRWHFFEESKDGCFCVGGCKGRLSRDQAEDMLNEHAALKRALRDVYKGPSAQAVDFTRSPELCQWVCDTIDMVADVLTAEESE